MMFGDMVTVEILKGFDRDIYNNSRERGILIPNIECMFNGYREIMKDAAAKGFDITNVRRNLKVVSEEIIETARAAGDDETALYVSRELGRIFGN
jgi:hypothetical protein